MPSRFTTLAVLMLAACSTTVFAAAPGTQPSANTTASNLDTMQPEGGRKKAPSFHLTDAQGHPISLEAYKGQVVLLDFWATWCGGCKLEIPWFMAFDKQYKPQGLAVIGVAMDDEGWAKVRPFLAQPKDEETGGNTAMQYPVILGNASLSQAYGLTSMPMTVLIDREGKIALSHTGVVDQSDFEQHIQQLLRER